MAQHEIRLNKASGDWVIIAPSRGKRPDDFQREEKLKSLPEYDANCPFCKGNEEDLPDILLQIGNDDENWHTRVVPNKFPAVHREKDTERYSTGIYTAMPGYGVHEVILEHPHHNQDMATMSRENAESVIETYHRRMTDLMMGHQNMLPILFRNHGANAGTSLHHPHSQLIITGFVPSHIRHRENEAQRYFDKFGRCVFCEILEFERSEAIRTVFENDSFLAFVPYAAESPFEVWIMPKQHQADFCEIDDHQKKGLTEALQGVLTQLHDQLKDPDYNYIINTAARYKADEPQLHWYIQVRPRLTTRAGFEIGSGISINPSVPEEDAKYLRNEE